MKNIKSLVMKLFITVGSLIGIGSLIGVTFTLFGVDISNYFDMSRTQDNRKTINIGNIEKVVVTTETANLPSVLDRLLSASVSDDITSIIADRQSVSIAPERIERKESAKIDLSADKITTTKVTEDKKTTQDDPSKISGQKKEAEIHNVNPLNSDVLQNGIPHTDFLITRNDKNTYKFTLDSSCAVNITFSSSGKDNASYKLTVQDTSGYVLTQKMIDGETYLASTGNLYLRAGTYIIRLERGYSWSGKPYTITINASQAVNTEEESNDTIQTANDIPLNEDVRASSSTRNDTDYFRFTLDEASYVRPNLEFAPVSSEGKIYSLKLYELAVLNADKKPFVFRGDNKASRKIKPFILEAGTYIIAVSRVEDTEKLELGLHEYTLRI